MTENPPAAPDSYEHHFVYRILGGQPISVGVCQFCHDPNWADLAEQATRIYRWGRDEAVAGKPARDRISAYGMPREDEQPAAPSVPADTDLRELTPAEIANHVGRAIWALKTPSPTGSEHYCSGWDDGLDAAGDAARDAVLAVLAVLPAPADQGAVLRDFLWRLEQSAGDAAAEKLLDDNPELRRMADEAQQAGEAR